MAKTILNFHFDYLIPSLIDDQGLTPPCLTKCTISRRVHVYSFQRGWSSCIRQCHRGSRMWVSLQSSSSLLSSSLSPSSSSCHHHRHYHYHASASVLVQWSMIKTELELLFKRMHLIIKSSQLRIPLHQVHENNQQSEIATRNQSKVRKKHQTAIPPLCKLAAAATPFQVAIQWAFVNARVLSCKWHPLSFDIVNNAMSPSEVHVLTIHVI